MSFASVIKSPTLLADYGDPSSNFYPSGTFDRVPSPSDSHVPGAWYELHSGLPCDIDGMVIFAKSEDNQHTRQVAMDVAIGSSGNEVIVVEGILGQQKTYYTYGAEVYLPLRLQRGTRIALRSQWATDANQSYSIRVRGLFIPRSGMYPTGFGRCITVGFDRESTTGTDLSLGNSHETWGTAVQISSGVPYRVRAIAASFHSHVPVTSAVIRIHSGASGRAIVPVAMFTNNAVDGLGAGRNFRYLGPYPVDVPPGTSFYIQQIGAPATAGYYIRAALHLFG